MTLLELLDCQMVDGRLYRHEDASVPKGVFAMVTVGDSTIIRTTIAKQTAVFRVSNELLADGWGRMTWAESEKREVEARRLRRRVPEATGQVMRRLREST